MKTILLQVNNDKAYKLIQDLEALDIVKVLQKSAQSKRKLSEKFAGALHLFNEEYHSLQNSLSQSRNEWAEDIDSAQ